MFALKTFISCYRTAGSRNGGLSKGAFCAKQTFLQGNGLPSAVLQGNGWPSAVVTRHPLGLGKSVQSRTGLVVANPICKCRCHKAGHLQVRVAVGRRSTCVLKEALLNQGPLGLPQEVLDPRRFLMGSLKGF